MKYLLMSLAVLLAAVPFAAEQPREEQAVIDQAAGPESGDREERPASDSAEPPQQEPSAGSAWPRQFVPTEKINADSVVAFPADI